LKILKNLMDLPFNRMQEGIVPSLPESGFYRYRDRINYIDLSACSGFDRITPMAFVLT